MQQMSSLQPFKDRLRHGPPALSMIVRLVRGPEIARIAKTAGFDAIYVDLEHSTHSIEEACQICLAAADLGLAGLVRVPEFSRGLIGRLLDGGAQGLIVPGIETAEDARQAAQALSYPPRGTRSLAAALPLMQYANPGGRTALDTLAAATLLAVMVESPRSLRNVGAIAAVEGVDLLFIGLNDLCASLELPRIPSGQALLELLEPIFEAAAKHGKAVGIGGLPLDDGETTRCLISTGARLLSTGSDIAFLLAGAQARRAALRSATESLGMDPGDEEPERRVPSRQAAPRADG